MTCIYRSMPAGVAQSRHAFVGGTVSMWGRWQIPVNKRKKSIRNADQALTVRGEHADRIVGSPASMPEELKLSQIGSSQLPPPFRGLHSPGVRKHCQIIFACYFRKSSIVTPQLLLTGMMLTSLNKIQLHFRMKCCWLWTDEHCQCHHSPNWLTAQPMKCYQGQSYLRSTHWLTIESGFLAISSSLLIWSSDSDW